METTTRRKQKRPGSNGADRGESILQQPGSWTRAWKTGHGGNSLPPRLVLRSNDYEW